MNVSTDIESRKAVAQRREELINRIYALGARTPSPAEIAAHNQEHAALVAELEGLSVSTVGIIAISRGLLGAPWEGPDYAADRQSIDDAIREDPFASFARETGQAWR